MNVQVNVGDLVFVREGGPSVGAVRKVQAHELTIDIEGIGDVVITASQVRAVHDGKVVLDVEQLAPEIQAAVEHANDDESNYR